MLLLACAFLGVAALDFSHLLSIQGMPVYVTPSDPEKAINFWLAARLLAATALLAFAFCDPQKRYSKAAQYGLLLTVAVVTALVHWLVLFSPEAIPRTFIKGQGLTDFKRAFEYGLVGLNLAAMVALLWRMRRPLAFNAAAVVGAIGAMAMSEFFLTLYSDVTDVYILAGHIYKVISYLYLYNSIFMDAIDQPYLELRQATQALQRSREDLSMTLNSIGDAVIATNTKGLVTRMNPVAERLTGWPLAQALRQPLTAVFNIIDAESRLPSVNPVQRVIETGKVMGLANHTVLLSRGGRQYQISDSAAPIRDASGVIVGVVLVFSDVSDKLQAEHALRDANAHLQTTLNAIPDLLFEVDASGRMLSYRAHRSDLLAAPPDMIVGKCFADVLPPDATEVCMNALKEAAAKGWATGATYALPLPQGETWFELSVAAMPPVAGVVPRFILLARDITERRHNQLALQTSLREKTALLLEVHHRVKNNLQVINSLLRLEGSRTKDSTTKAVLQDMQSRVRSIALLHETIYRKGSFAAIDLGKYVGQVAGESLRTLLTAQGAVQLRLNMVAVQVGLDQASPAGMLISELISNCLKHGFPDGRKGEIVVSLQPLDDAGCWRLQVSDSGMGLPADFEARRKNSLGLQLTGDLAMQLGGELHIGAGPQAVFTIDFKAEVPEPLVIHLSEPEV